MSQESPEITQMLLELTDGNEEVVNQILPHIYDELRRLASSYLRRERSNHTLQPTALVHEAYMKLIDQSRVKWQNRAHFFAAAAEAMRRILIEHARHKQSLKRGGGREQVELHDELPAVRAPCDDAGDLLALDDVLDRLSSEHPQQAELIKLLYFAGLNLDEAAAAMGISRTTAHRQRVFARAWLFDAMNQQ